MANKEVIDVDFTEVKTDGTKETETTSTEKPEGTTETAEKQPNVIIRIGKKYGKPIAFTALAGAVVYGIHKAVKAYKGIPASIKDDSSNKLYTVITGSVPKDSLNEDELGRWNEAVDQLRTVMDEAKERLSGVTE